MPFHTIIRAIQRKINGSHQGTSHTVFFVWQCVEMALEGWHLMEIMPHHLAVIDWIELIHHCALNICMHLSSAQKWVNKLAYAQVRALLWHAEVDKDKINFDATLPSLHCCHLFLFLSSNFLPCVFPKCLFRVCCFFLKTAFWFTEKFSGLKRRRWSKGSSLPLLNRIYYLWLRLFFFSVRLFFPTIQP